MNSALIPEAVDVEAIAVRLAVSRASGALGDELAGRRRSRAAIRRWKERLPVQLTEDGDLAYMVDRHSVYWLRSAGSLVRSLDPSGLGAGDFHVVDSKALGIEAHGLAGFTFPGRPFFEIARPVLPTTSRPGPVVAVNVLGQARSNTTEILETASEATLRETVRIGISATVLHEAAHVLDFELAGKSLPVDATIQHLRLASKSPPSPATRSTNHGAGWVRAFAHLVWRTSRIPPVDYWEQIFRFDVSAYFTGDAADFLDALSVELVSTSHDEPVLDILRRPAAPEFIHLIETRGVAA